MPRFHVHMKQRMSDWRHILLFSSVPLRVTPITMTIHLWSAHSARLIFFLPSVSYILYTILLYYVCGNENRGVKSDISLSYAYVCAMASTLCDPVWGRGVSALSSTSILNLSTDIQPSVAPARQYVHQYSLLLLNHSYLITRLIFNCFLWYPPNDLYVYLQSLYFMGGSEPCLSTKQLPYHSCQWSKQPECRNSVSIDIN